MRIIRYDYPLFNLSVMRRGLKTSRLRTKLLVALIPSVVFILILTGYITMWFSSKFLTEALRRNVQTQTAALAHEFETFLTQCKEDLLIISQRLSISQSSIASSDMVHFLEARKNVRGIAYSELGYISLKGEEHIFIIAGVNDVSVIPTADIAMIRPSPLILFDHVKELKKGEVWVSDILEAVYPVNGLSNPAIPDSAVNTTTPGPDLDNRLDKSIRASSARAGLNGEGLGGGEKKEPVRIIRFVTPYFGGDASPEGFLLLSIDVYRLREILSLFNSPRSPVYAFARSPEVRYSYLFDKEGWVLFQSEEMQGAGKHLATDLVRSEFSGVCGRPGLDCAFKPDSVHREYWKMMDNVRNGKQGLIEMTGGGNHFKVWSSLHFHGYAPIRFKVASDHKPVLFGGVGLVDRSKLTLLAGYRQIDVMFVITLLTIIIISLLIFGLSRIITRPILDLAAAVNDIQETGKLQEITLPDHDDESSSLKNAINKMVATLRAQIEEIRIKDERIRIESQREKARLEEEVNVLKKRLQSRDIEEIIGSGPLMDALKADIFKAASVDADVLIIGETGTGKQLVAEAIHNYSGRAEKEFVSINCGALDENLLLDTLFGHVKGAFTEARADRKGAFLAAHGGTLFLDEIGTASPRVQQALLRTISSRKIKPLGSDSEIDVDVRLINATNVDLKELIQKRMFREDLYYRLEVLTIPTPALRNHKDNIPVLVGYFLKQAGRLMNKRDVGLSKGALEKMKNYNWPGNVRELMNCVTRAVAMAEGPLIYADDIRLGGEESVALSKQSLTGGQPETYMARFPTEMIQDVSSELNVRQRTAIHFILDKGKITRAKYQEVVGNNLPSRTALYDLQDLVARGVLRKAGRGPATCYYLAELPDISG